jgi:hypothetical protein
MARLLRLVALNNCYPAKEGKNQKMEFRTPLIARLSWQRLSFNLEGKDLFTSLYGKNYLLSRLS